MRPAIESLFRAIAPHDLAGVPLYVVLESAFAGAVPFHATAITGRSLDLSFQPLLEAAARWQGRGVAVAIDDEYLRADAYTLAFGDEPLRRELFEQRFFSIALHELGHVLESRIDLASKPVTADAVAEQVEVLATYTKTIPTLTVPFYGHDAAWVRPTLHAVHRAALLGIVAPLPLVMRLASYGLSSPWAYRAALRPELRTMEHATFAEIRATRPPQPFIDLWQADVHRWFESLKAPTEKQTKIRNVYSALFD